MLIVAKLPQGRQWRLMPTGFSFLHCRIASLPMVFHLADHANAGLDAESAGQAGAKKMPHKRPGRQIDRLTPRQKAMVFILGSMVKRETNIL